MPRPIILLAFTLFAATAADVAGAFRCGNRIVTEGDDLAHVIHICGEPATARQWTEVVVRPVFLYGRSDHYGAWRHTRYRHPVALPVEIVVEEWTYNLGARRFMRVLRFENGQLVNIRATRYGSTR